MSRNQHKVMFIGVTWYPYKAMLIAVTGRKRRTSLCFPTIVHNGGDEIKARTPTNGWVERRLGTKKFAITRIS